MYISQIGASTNVDESQSINYCILNLHQTPWQITVHLIYRLVSITKVARFQYNHNYLKVSGLVVDWTISQT